jgi:hypothetical protein
MSHRIASIEREGGVKPRTHEAGALPNLLVVGAAKCGTTSLHGYLDAHPDIAMSSAKELNFFIPDGTWSRGVNWYRGQFDPTATVRGESSTSYTSRPDPDQVAKRVRSVLSDVKLIYLTRDPLERIRSHYHHRHAARVERRSLRDALGDPDNPYLPASLYATQLAPFVACFGQDRILVETQERLLTERQACLRRIFRFLDVDDRVERPEFERVWERSEGKGWGYSLAWRLAQRGVRLPPSLRWPAQRMLRSRLLGGAGRRTEPPVIDEALRAALAPRFQREADSLRQMTGMSFAEWSV